MPIAEEDVQRKKKPHEVGEDLGTLSLDELEERIVLLQGEIARIEEAIRIKRASATVADFSSSGEGKNTTPGRPLAAA